MIRFNHKKKKTKKKEVNNNNNNLKMRIIIPFMIVYLYISSQSLSNTQSVIEDTMVRDISGNDESSIDTQRINRIRAIRFLGPARSKIFRN
jgi:hypothetical protein